MWLDPSPWNAQQPSTYHIHWYRPYQQQAQMYGGTVASELDSGHIGWLAGQGVVVTRTDCIVYSESTLSNIQMLDSYIDSLEVKAFAVGLATA